MYNKCYMYVYIGPKGEYRAALPYCDVIDLSEIRYLIGL